jgi:hypothetical protein
MPVTDPKPDPKGSRERQMFERLFEELDSGHEPEVGPDLPEIAQKQCPSLYPQVWVGPDRRCTLETGHERGNPPDLVHQHLNLLFWHVNSSREAISA